MSPVAFVTTRHVIDGHEPDYEAWLEKVATVLTRQPGFVEAEVIPAGSSGQDFWTQIVRFADKPASLAWRDSAELANLMAEVEAFSSDSEVSAVRTGGSDWLNFGFSTKPGPGAPIKWKQLIAGVMALFPTVVIVHEILSALFTLPFAISTLLTNAISMALVMLLWLPGLSKVLGYWLLPQEPLPAWKNVGTTALCLAIIALLTGIFLALFG